MKILRKNTCTPIPEKSSILNLDLKTTCSILVFLGLTLLGCSDFVEVDPPKNTLVSETVFEDPSTVASALADLYYSMREEQGMVSGTFGLTTAMGIYSDELDYFGFNANYIQLYNHNLIAGNDMLLSWWSQAYRSIYSANAIIAGVENSASLSAMEKNSFKGQALFVRAYIHSMLVSLFGEIPYVTTTDYVENNNVSRMSEEAVYEKIIADLGEAIVLLEGLEPGSNERVVPDQQTVMALLSRVYLHVENWEMAASLATEPIARFPLETDLDQVFLKDSPETIWQLKPEEGYNTKEAAQLIIPAVPGQTYALTDDLLELFEIGDLRLNHWVESISDADNSITFHYPFKYKADLSEMESLEYSILFRSAEQYLIRAEARAHMGDSAGAQEDLNAVRNRAGLPDLLANTKKELLDAIYHERGVELFAEQGHRWFDLKRTGRANAELGGHKPNWKDTDLLLPIPEAELETNPNLLPQNPGY